MPEEPRRLEEDLAAARCFSSAGTLRTLRAENTEAARNSTSGLAAEKLTLVLRGEYSKS
jgi:hypothetical protein